MVLGGDVGEGRGHAGRGRGRAWGAMRGVGGHGARGWSARGWSPRGRQGSVWLRETHAACRAPRSRALAPSVRRPNASKGMGSMRARRLRAMDTRYPSESMVQETREAAREAAEKAAAAKAAAAASPEDAALVQAAAHASAVAEAWEAAAAARRAAREAAARAAAVAEEAAEKAAAEKVAAEKAVAEAVAAEKAAAEEAAEEAEKEAKEEGEEEAEEEAADPPLFSEVALGGNHDKAPRGQLEVRRLCSGGAVIEWRPFGDGTPIKIDVAEMKGIMSMKKDLKKPIIKVVMKGGAPPPPGHTPPGHCFKFPLDGCAFDATYEVALARVRAKVRVTERVGLVCLTAPPDRSLQPQHHL